MTASTAPSATVEAREPSRAQLLLYRIGLPLLSIFTALLIGAIAMWLTGSNPLEAYKGLIDGAFLKPRAFDETLVATTPYILLALGVGFGFKCGLFNIGVEGQYYIGQLAAVWVAANVVGLPLWIHLPLVILVGMLGGGIWAGIPGFLKVRFGAHEVIVTIMMNWIAFLLADYLVGMNGPMRDPAASIPQSRPIQPSARLPQFHELPTLMASPLARIVVALLIAVSLYLLIRLIVRYGFGGRLRKANKWILLGIGVVLAIGSWILLGNLPMFGGTFTDKADRLHVGFLVACGMAVFMWWLLYKTTFGFEIRTVGANKDAARYAGINITRNVVLAMAISGALAGLAGTIEIVGLARVLVSFFSAGYGFESIAIALLANSHPLGTIPSAFLFGALRNGADLMELRSGVSKQMIAIVQGLIVMFVAAPGVIRWIYHIKAPRGEKQASVTSGWGK
jgi:general nucleoside transport system permease protein